MNVLALCAGFGGLELGLRLVGENPRVVCYVEIEAFAAANLVAAIEAGAMDSAPIWTDVRTFDGRPWRGSVDCLTAGFPCQPFSVAGKGKGTADHRWIWPDIGRIIGEVRPRFVFLENVPPLVKRGLGPVLGTLARLRYNAEWGIFSAAEAGAPHRRRRFYMVAQRIPDADRERVRYFAERGQGRTQAGDRGYAEPQDVGASLANPAGDRLRVDRTPHDDRRGNESGYDPHGRREAMGDADGARRSPPRSDQSEETHERGSKPRSRRRAMGNTSRSRPSEHASLGGDTREEYPPFERASGFMGFPPGPEDVEGWQKWLAADGPKPCIRGGAYGTPDRVDRVRLAGNGAVPQQAALAWRTLRGRFYGR